MFSSIQSGPNARAVGCPNNALRAGGRGSYTAQRRPRSFLARVGAVSNGDACTVHYVERLASNDAVVRDSRARKEAEQDDGDREEVRFEISAGADFSWVSRRSHAYSFVRSFVRSAGAVDVHRGEERSDSRD